MMKFLLTDLVTWPLKCKLVQWSTCGLCNKISDLLKVRQTLDCVAADTNYMNIYSHIYVNTGNVICQLQNEKSNFPKFCKGLLI